MIDDSILVYIQMQLSTGKRRAEILEELVKGGVQKNKAKELIQLANSSFKKEAIRIGLLQICIGILFILLGGIITFISKSYAVSHSANHYYFPKGFLVFGCFLILKGFWTMVKQ